jgi:hypothetical protein
MIGKTMNYYFTGILIILICLLTFIKPAYPGSTQTNTSGSNTAIEGGYTSTATTTYESGSESTTTTNNTTNSDIKSSPPSASAPSYNSMTQDVCAVGVSAGVQTFGFGVSGYKQEHHVQLMVRLVKRQKHCGLSMIMKDQIMTYM